MAWFYNGEINIELLFENLIKNMNKSSRLSTAESANSRNMNIFTASSIQSIKYSVGSSGQLTTASRSNEHPEVLGNRQRFIHAQHFSNMFNKSNEKKQLVDGRFLIETGP